MDPATPDLVERIARIAALPGITFKGLLSHAGHAYHASSHDELAAMAATETEIMVGLAGRLRAAGVHVDEVSVGSTPTASFVPTQHGITEMRPGNYVFYDRTQVGLGSATISDCALFVVASVVSRPAPDRVILDCGSKTLTNDGCRGFDATPGHGLVFLNPDNDVPDAAIVVERLSEEHATCRVPVDSPLRPGDRVRVLPNHSCTVTNLMDSLVLAEDDGAIEPLVVAARGRIW
jgi:D-serine deaminase-like pyridoxal phosphate-dependent protein